MQEALKKIEDWTRKWMVTLNAKKTTFTIFSLSTRAQTTILKVGDHTLPEYKSPTYLGVTFDPRMIWKNQIDRSTKRARLRLCL
ncbi:hypothetical protein V1264_022894 [Littorina saxatilis]|uniref:Reverse transcriptase domain-containing protein n=1 Tax=Littorina saxatilis TaxID=31220 RepID=A0AAN9B768_9CAEN